MAEGGYRAFISYSHRDAAAAQALHRKLEGYRIPRRLVGTIGEHGPVPRRLTPIFRDRDELPAAGDLSEKVRGALAASHALVILCSPHAAASLWVTREIETFREIDPGRPILAAILDGEPGDCFPAALGSAQGGAAPIEPLAADLRLSGDGRRLGFLKLVAGLAGVGLDALVQRDAARQIRRVTAVTLTAVAAMLAMAVLTIIALNARHEAERQRAQAEGLVEFMLTDLRTRLKGVGRLDVMDAVNQRAIAYYGGPQALDRLSDDSLERRARILHAMGEDEVARGDMRAALSRFREAHAVTGATLARHPSEAGAIFAHGQSDYWIGRVHELRREWGDAERQYVLYAHSGRQLIAIAPGNPDYMMECGWGALNLGIVKLSGAGNYAEAESRFREAVGWFEKAGRTRKDDAAQREQANASAWLADSFYGRKLWRQSLEARQAQLRIIADLHRADPANGDKILVLATAERSIARLKMHLLDEPGAAAFLSKARARLRDLVARDPSNTEWRFAKVLADCDVLRTRLPAEKSNSGVVRNIKSDISYLKSRRDPRVLQLSACSSVLP